MKKKGQSAIEFMILIGFLLVGFVIFLSVVNGNLEEKASERQNLKIQEIATTVVEEIDFATTAGDGYSRNFTLPPDVYGNPYTIAINESIVFVKTIDVAHQISYEVKNVTGSANPGENSIKNNNGEVILNE